jgi:hypothetical protein
MMIRAFYHDYDVRCLSPDICSENANLIVLLTQAAPIIKQREIYPTWNLNLLNESPGFLDRVRLPDD